MKTCPSCQSTFSCEASQGASCWCMNLPPLLEPDPLQNCLCPSCLAKAITRSIEEKIIIKTHQEILEIASPYKSQNGFIEHVDYTVENGNYVFTKWYHLKRGSCCGNECRNCPY